MKAYQIWDSTDDDKYMEIVYANSASEAKQNQCEIDPDSFIDLRAKRAPYADNTENLSVAEKVILLVKNGWWYELGNRRITDDNLNENLEYIHNFYENPELLEGVK